MTKPASGSVQSLSASLSELSQAGEEKLSLGEIVERFEGRGGLGPVLFVLTCGPKLG